ncbi:MAG: hypothetical protein ACYTG7_15650, partial [Planctomycetota bacterium]
MWNARPVTEPSIPAMRLGLVIVLALAFMFTNGSSVRAQDEDVKGARAAVAKEKTAKPENEAEEEKKEEKDRYFALLGGDLHTVTGPVLKGTDVLVKNGIITRIGAGLELPEECEKLDVEGMRVYPGLIAVGSRGLLGKEPPENSTDLYGLNMLLALAGGITTVVTGNTAAKLTFGTTEGMILKRDVFLTLRYGRGAPKARHDLRKDLEKVRQYLR